MKVTVDTIKHVAKLARLNLTEEQIQKFTPEMEEIIQYVDKLNELDTEGIEPTAHVMPVYNVQREDVVKESFDRDLILKNAATVEDGCFKVPKIVE